MQLSKVPFSDLKRSIRREVIKGFKKRGDPDTHQDMEDVPLELVAAALDVEEHFSGNVDARRVREVAAIYGFSTNSNRSLTHDGAELLTIKNIRNDLAHGIKTYEEVGRDYPIKRLLEISIRATAYMAAILDNVSAYLDAEEFREMNPTTENLVKVIWRRLAPRLKHPPLYRVTVHETDKNSFAYYGEGE